ncbi:DUF3306 domain-containing protein [Lutimaribacter marinistellae]|uniref:DUF3306 domain-containing protein n=1 Tax=Lutimaribacter marinistellae TaxID=1820329 RepID=A0ABV7TN93_9RHOB
MTRAQDFWSRRRAAVAEEARTEEVATLAEKAAEERRALETRSDEEILAELDLPDPDTIAPGDDVAAFLREVVPERLRRRALRRLWQINPVLANVDGLVDYGEDFTDATCVIENLQTAYQVGRGMLSHVEHLAMAETEPTADQADAEIPAQADTTEEIPQACAPVTASADTATEEKVPDGDFEEVATPAPRRMRFVFDKEQV